MTSEVERKLKSLVCGTQVKKVFQRGRNGQLCQMQQTGRVREKLRIDIGFGGAKVVGDLGTVSLQREE